MTMMSSRVPLLAGAIVLGITLAAESARSVDPSPEFDSNCYNFRIGGVPSNSPVRMIQDAVILGLNVRQTSHFQECIRLSGYRRCPSDLSGDVEDGVRVALSTNHLIIGCQTTSFDADGEADVATELFHSNPER